MPEFMTLTCDGTWSYSEVTFGYFTILSVMEAAPVAPNLLVEAEETFFRAHLHTR